MIHPNSTELLWPQLTLVATVAASHMSMPNHWLPYSLVARAHSWTLRKALFLSTLCSIYRAVLFFFHPHIRCMTQSTNQGFDDCTAAFLGALGHVTNTIVVSLIISEIGGVLISHDHYRLLSSSVLFVGGVYYLYTYTVRRNRSSCCSPQSLHDSSHGNGTVGKDVSASGDSAAVHRTAEVSVVMLTALSPCVGSMPVLVSLMAPPVKLSTVLAAGAVLLVTSALIMCSLVGISYLGAAKLDFEKIRRHERLILGLGLVILAGLTYFVFDGDHAHHAHGDVDGHVHMEHVGREVFTDGLHANMVHVGDR